MKAFFNREPLSANSTALLSLGEIRPRGWLQRQLEKQAEALTGILADAWPDAGPDCAWPDRGDGGEHALYCLDGLVTLAFLLDDGKLKEKAKQYTERILTSRRQDGWFGPENNDDYWPRILCLKALYSYFTATIDKRVLELMDGFFKYEYRNLDAKPLREWACARGGDNIFLALKMYNITGQQYLLELCKKLREQTLDWTTAFDVFPNMTAMSKAVPWDKLKAGMDAETEEMAGTARPYYHTLFHKTHGVNVSMGLKTPGVISTFKPGFKEQTGFKNGWEKLQKYHGTANGMFTCDEHINGNSPSKGTEACAVAEAMYSIETLMDAGDFGNNLPDTLEKLAYNALPAMFTDDMKSRQLLGQANQISCAEGVHGWYNSGADANVFTTETDSRSRASGLYQAWPRFVQSLWYATGDGGLTAVSYAPCYVEHVIDGVPVYMDVRGDYPFSENVEIEINTRRAIEFPLYLRIPYWSENTMIQLPGGEIMSVRAGETACIRERWNGMGLIRITFSMKPKVNARPHNSCSVEAGPLVMALKLNEEKQTDGAGTLYTTGDVWAYALVADAPLKVEFAPDGPESYKNGGIPLKVDARCVPCREWQAEGCDTGAFPGSAVYSPDEIRSVELVPYGYTNLRINQFPAVEAGEGKN